MAEPSSAAESLARPRLRNVSWSRRFGALAPYLLLLPALLFLLALFALPMLQAAALAVQTPDTGAFTFDHLRRMASDVNFGDALRNTLLLIALAVPLQVGLAIVMGLLVQARLRGSGFFLYAWTVPLAVCDLAAGLVWLAIFSDRGYLNSALQGLGLLDSPFAFLSYEHPVSLVGAVVVAEVWRATAIVMVIIVAGWQLIPRDYFEAADVFGATPWQRLWHVTLPLIRPSLQVALMLRTILAFQAFAVVIALGGRALPVLTSEAYTWYVGNRNAHVAAAYALVILAFSLVTTTLYLRALRLRVEEMGR